MSYLQTEIVSYLSTCFTPEICKDTSSNKPWTKALLTAFKELGYKHGWLNCCASIEGASSEWLFDLTWRRKKNEDELEIGLILEVEWSPYPQDLKCDFQKLLVGKSPYKVFVFANTPNNTVEDLIALIKLCKHSSKGETYILANWINKTMSFKFYFFSDLISHTPIPQ